MKHAKYIFLLLTLSFGLPSIGIACTVDVTINEGATIEMCEDPGLSISASNGYVSYTWSGPESLSGQTITPSFSGQYVVDALDAFGCTSTATIQVTINPNPTPTILSSEGNPICPSSAGSTLSVDSPYVLYDWGGGNSSPTSFVTGPGAYAVTVTDTKGCTGHTVITLTSMTFDLSSTPVSGCSGTTTFLEASGGTNYLWSTGETGSSIVVDPTITTNYSVSIGNGTCSELLTVAVAPGQELNFALVDTLYMGLDEIQTLQGPSGFATYNWYPTDQLDNPFGEIVSITGSTSFTLFLEATHSSGCVIKDSVVIIVVDLDIPNGFSPNDDSFNDLYIVPQLYYLDGSLKVWNRWGDVVFESDHYENNWDGTCQTSLCVGNEGLPEGTYFYAITVGDIDFDGYITLKR